MGWANLNSKGQSVIQTLGSQGLTPVRVVLIAGVLLLVAFPFIFPFTGASGSPLPSASPTPPPPGNGTTPEVSFTVDNSSAAESVTPAELEVVLSNSSTQTVTVDFAVTGGSAEGAGVDYTLAAGTLTFAPGDTSETISVGIIDDLLDEPDETIIVTLSNPSNAELGSPVSHTYTIEDNDTVPAVTFSGEASSGAESASPAELEVVLTHSSSQPVTVDFAVGGGSANGGGVDYTLAAGTLTFAPGDTSEIISIVIVDDLLDELDETIVVDLSNPSNATLGAPISHAYTVVDDDGQPSVEFVSAVSHGAESVTPVNLEVKLSPASSQTVTVDFSVAGGTATGVGVDYTLAAGTLTFSPGEVFEIIGITVIDDGLAEADETIVVTLSNPNNAVLGGRTAHTYIIKDNDEDDGVPGGQPGTGSGNVIIGNGNTIGSIIIGNGNSVGNVKVSNKETTRNVKGASVTKEKRVVVKEVVVKEVRVKEVRVKENDHDDENDNDDGDNNDRHKNNDKKLGENLTKEACKKGGWAYFKNPSFKNQGQCVRASVAKK